jgi:PPOX class probable F420-dependent enzyme
MEIAEELRAFIDSQRVARLATVDTQHRPHVVPVCFVLEGTIIYSAIDEKPKRPGATLKRLENIAANPDVQLLLDVYDDGDWSRLRYVQLRGQARVIDGGFDHERAIALLRERYRQYRDMALEHRPVIAIDVERIVEWSGRAR